MNANQLQNDMELVDSQKIGEINVQWGEGNHFWFGILQWDEDEKRTYTWTYECCGSDDCGNNEYEQYDTIDELFAKKGRNAEGFDWQRCGEFPPSTDSSSDTNSIMQQRLDLCNKLTWEM